MEDYWICKGVLQAKGNFIGAPTEGSSLQSNVDPWDGAPIPPRRPPPGQYRAESRAQYNIIAYSVAIVFISLFTLTRLYLRAFSKRMKWGLDDWLMLVAFVGICSVIYGGAGHHMYDITYHEFRMYKIIGAVQSFTFFLAVSTLKMSIVAFNMRLTGLTSRGWMIIHWTFFACMVVFATLAVFLNAFGVRPPRARFDLVYAGQMDTLPVPFINNKVWLHVLSAIHVLSDILLLSFFGIVLWKLQMSIAVKCRLLMVLAVGLLSFVAAIKVQTDHIRYTTDHTWNFSKQMSWTLVDLTSGVIAASLPILSTLFLNAFNTIKGSFRSYTGGTSAHTGASSSVPHARFADSTPMADISIYAVTPGWEKPFGHVEEKEAWTTRKTVRHDKEG
ncbi:MAG: hypothetical protein Q9193_006703, partial [Seirophora villosa]